MAKTKVKTKAKLLRGLTFEIQELPRGSKEDLSTPLNVKVKYKSKHPELFENNVICLPKIENAPCDEVRVVRSDQTLMSFKVLMENDIRATKTSSKSRRIFKKCLGINYDGNDSYLYLPSAAIESNHVVSSVTEEMQKRKKKKYKSGGCLDPVISDDNNYVYKPKAPRKSLNLKIIDSLLFGKATDSPIESEDLDFVKRNENKNNSILSIFKAEPDKLLLDSKYSNTIITYPPEATSSSQLIKDGLQNKFRSASSQLQQQIQIHQSKQGFYVPTNVSKHENLDTFDIHDFVRTLKEQAKRKSDDTMQLITSKKEPDKPKGSHEEDLKYKSILRSGISSDDQSIDNVNHHQLQIIEQNLNNVVIGIIPITENKKETLPKNPRQPLKPDCIENEEKKVVLDKIEILNNDNLINSQDKQDNLINSQDKQLDVQINKPKLIANNVFNRTASNLLIKDDVLRTANDDTSRLSDEHNGKNIIETSSIKNKLYNDDSAIIIQGIPNDKHEPQVKKIKQNEEIKYQRTTQHLFDNKELITENNLELLEVPKTATKDLREHNMISATASTIYDKRNNFTFVPLITAKESGNLITDKQDKIPFDQNKSQNMGVNVAKETQIVEDQSQYFDRLKENFNIPSSDTGINSINNCENDKNYARQVEKQNKDVLEKTPSEIKLDKQISELTKHQSPSKRTSIMNTPEYLSQKHTNRQNQLGDRKSIDKPSNKQTTSTERESMNSHVVLIKPQELTTEQTNFEGEDKRKLSFLKRNDSSFLDRDDEDKDVNDDSLLIQNQKSSSRDKIIFRSKVPKSIKNSGQGESKEQFRENTNTNGDKTGNDIKNGGTSSNTVSSLPHAIKMKSYEKNELISIGSIKTNSVHNLPKENENFVTKFSYRDKIISDSKVSKPNENSEQEENNSISSEQFREITDRNDVKIGNVVKNGGTSSNTVSSSPYAIDMKSYEKYETISKGSIKTNSIDNLPEEIEHFGTKSSYRDKIISGSKVSKPNSKSGQEDSNSISNEQFRDITNADEDNINNGIQNEHFGTKCSYRNKIISGSMVSKPNKKSVQEESNSTSSEQFRDITNADEYKISNGIQNDHVGMKSSYQDKIVSGSKISKPNKKSGQEESNSISSEKFRETNNADIDKINNGIQNSRPSSNTLHQNSSQGVYKIKSYEKSDVTSAGSIKTNSSHNLHQYERFSGNEIKTATPLKICDTPDTVHKERSVDTDAVPSLPKLFETESYERYEVKTVRSIDNDVIHSSPVIYETETYEAYEGNPLKQVRTYYVHDSPNIVVSNIRYKVNPESIKIYDSETSKTESQMGSQTSKYMYDFDKISNEPMKYVSSSKLYALSEEKDKMPELQEQVANMEQIYVSSSKQNLENEKDKKFISYRKDTHHSIINPEIKYILSDTKLTHNVVDDLDKLKTSNTMDKESNPYASDRTRTSLVQHYDEKIKSPSNLDESKSILSQVTTNNLRIISLEDFKIVETTKFETSLKESRERKLQEYQNDKKSKFEEKSEEFLDKDIQDGQYDAQSPYEPNLTVLQQENIDNLHNRKPTYKHIKPLDDKNNIDYSGATYGKQISKTNDSSLLSHDSVVQNSDKEPHENDYISKNNIKPYDFNASHNLILETKQSEKSQKPNMELKQIHTRISRSVSAGSLPMKLDLAFESYVNKNNETIIIKSVDSHIKSQNAIYVNTAVDHSKEIKIDIDKINNMSIKIQQKQEVAKGYGTDNVHDYKKDWKKMNPQISGVGGKLQKTLSSIYKKEIVPLKDTIKNLREEIDQLATLQESIRSKLYGRKSMKVRRVMLVNKNCVCVKFEDNKICKKK